MKKILVFLIVCLLLTACTPKQEQPTDTTPAPTEASAPETTAETSLPPQTTAPETITIYVPNDTADGFVEYTAPGPVMAALMDAQVLTSDVELQEFTQSEDGTALFADFNAVLKDLITTQGTTGEYLLLGSVVNSFLNVNEAESITITIDGEYLETGHNIYDYPLTFFQ